MVKNKHMMLLAISNLFLVFMGVGLVIPVMPQIKTQMHFSGAVMGMMVSIFALSQLIFSPIAGFLSDRLGRKKLIALGMIIFSISQFLFGLAHIKSEFYFARILGGIAAALVMPSVTAYVADVTDLSERPKAMGYVSAAISGGFIIGPGLGGFIAHFGMRIPFFSASLLSFIGFILTLIILKEPQTNSMLKNTDGDEELQKQVNSPFSILKNPVFTSLFIIILISSFGLQSFESIYSIMATINFKFTITQISLVVTCSGTFALIGQIFLFDWIVSKIGEIRLIQATFFVSALFIGVIALTRIKSVVVISTFITFFAFDLFRPAVTTYLSKHAGNNQGMINGLNSTFTSFGNIIGPMAAGSLFDLSHFLPYFVSSIVLFITGFLSLILKQEYRK